MTIQTPTDQDVERVAATLFEHLTPGKIWLDLPEVVRETWRGAARAALSSMLLKDERWMDIETAPKDGQRVMLWSAQWTAPACGIWQNAWTVGYDLPPYLYEPTHWMPLPPPPKDDFVTIKREVME